MLRTEYEFAVSQELSKGNADWEILEVTRKPQGNKQKSKSGRFDHVFVAANKTYIPLEDGKYIAVV